MATHFRSPVLAAGCLSLLIAPTVSSHELGKANESYVGDGGGHLITDGFGNCVKTSAWKETSDLSDCGAAPVKAAVEPEPTPAPVVQPAPAPAPAPVPEPVAVSFTLAGAALFAVDSNELSGTGKAELDRLATQLGSMNSVQSIHITGHTDSSGAAAYNQSLSEKRAATVRDYLVSQGVEARLITTEGKGESAPVASNATAQGRAENRRVEININGTRIK